MAREERRQCISCHTPFTDTVPTLCGIEPGPMEHCPRCVASILKRKKTAPVKKTLHGESLSGPYAKLTHRYYGDRRV